MVNRVGLWLTALQLVVLASTTQAAEKTSEELFRKQVAPLLARRCLSCHNDEDPKGGLSLATAQQLLTGGDSGPAVTPQDADGSFLLEMIAGEFPEMPKNADPLSEDEIASIRRWIETGAEWPEGFVIQPAQVLDTDWWSLKPLQRPPVPEVLPEQADWVRTPIDAFILAQLNARDLAPSPEADRRILIRRLYFDLLGLPPSPEEIETFVHDAEPYAYERLVDRLLESPRYGERWARHWLDVVHYGDTHGYDKDKPRPHAWPYRDYVIRSFNQDKPYHRFVREQIAGDVLWPCSPDAIEATGFIAAGPWDFIGHAEVPEDKIDGKIARNLDRDDMVTTTMNTFTSLTVQCARCHNHKFDPVTQEHYYSLQAVFAALDRADRKYDRDPRVARQRQQLSEKRESLIEEQATLQQQIRERAGQELIDLDEQITALVQQLSQGERPEFGYHSQIEAQQETVKWVQVDLGKSTPLQQIVVVGCHDDFNGIGAGFGFPVRWKIEVAEDPEFARDVVVIADHTAADYPNPGVAPRSFPAKQVSARYVRITATRLAPRQNDFILALAELKVVTPEGENVARGKKVTALDSIEQPARWQRANLVDGIYIGSQSDPQADTQLAALQKQREELLQQRVPADWRTRQQELAAVLAEVEQQLDALPPQQVVYAGTVHHGSGAFQGTGPRGGKPREIRVLMRGDVQSPGKLVGPGTVPILPEADWQFDLPPDHAEGARRVALANWLVRSDNPLTWRSIVNRIWLYHFGRGIVDSPNDFGRMGQRPTHPALLDWLAVEFRDGGQSFKQLHRLIVTSSVYRQVSANDPQRASLDAENRYLWRMNRRVLDAESIRDAVLWASGKLRSEMYGPGFQDFVIERPEHSPHYQYHKHDPNDPDCHRRSIYRFLVRSQQQPFMQTLDCADPSMLVPKRDTTLTAIQALTLMNNKFMVCMAEHFAARVASQAEQPEGQIRAAYRLALGREPDPLEQAELTAYARQFGLPNACRVILNLNEFVFVD